MQSIRFNDLRHTRATIMLKLGEHPKIVSERLSHSSIQMTMNVYSHVTIDMQKESSDRFEQAFQAAKKKLMRAKCEHFRFSTVFFSSVPIVDNDNA